jgi:hypothetical protein
MKKMITRIVKQVKTFNISSQSDYLCGHGFSESIPGISWVNEQVWVSDEMCQSLLEEAMADWERRRNENPWGTTSHRPALEIHWLTIDIQENGD